MNLIFSLDIKKPVLIKALSHMQTVVERRNIISILSNIKLTATGDGTLELTATDMSIAVTEKVAAQVNHAGSLTVSAHMFFDIARKLDDDTSIKLEITSENPTTLNIISGKSQFALSTLPVQDFPIIDSDNFSHKFSLTSNKLCEIIDKTKFAICNEDTRYNLNGMHLHFHKSLSAVTTDGHRLCVLEIPEVADLSDFPHIIIPKKTVIELRKIIDESKNNVEISLSSRKIQFECNEIIIISKLVDAKFPDYTGLVPHDNNFKIEADSKLFAKAIDRVSTINDEKFKGIKLTIEKDTLTFSANSDFGGSSKEVIAVHSNVTEKMEIGFNARYLLEGMMAIKGEKVILHIKDAFSSILIQDSDDKSFKYILMPMRV
jgi:DNA polymerase-3 subunit beta